MSDMCQKRRKEQGKLTGVAREGFVKIELCQQCGGPGKNSGAEAQNVRPVIYTVRTTWKMMGGIRKGEHEGGNI